MFCTLFNRKNCNKKNWLKIFWWDIYEYCCRIRISGFWSDGPKKLIQQRFFSFPKQNGVSYYWTDPDQSRYFPRIRQVWEYKELDQYFLNSDPKLNIFPIRIHNTGWKNVRQLTLDLICRLPIYYILQIIWWIGAGALGGIQNDSQLLHGGGGALHAHSAVFFFLQFNWNFWRQPRPENSRTFQIFLLRMPLLKKINSPPPLRALWNICLKIAHALKG